MNDRLRSTGRLLLVVALMTVVAACNTSNITKSGAPAPPDVKTLTMFVPSAGDPEAAYFADAVAARSNGRLRVVIDSATYNDADPQREQLVVGALRAGEADLGFVAGREFAQAGDEGFAALQAPFLITTAEAAVDVTNSSVAIDVLKGLSSAGVVGLALVTGEPRRLLTNRPVFSPDLGGARIRVVDNDQTSALITALGGIPVEHVVSRDVGALLRSGQLDGVESAPTYLLSGGYVTTTHYLSGHAMFTKINTIVANESLWRQLDDEQRAAVQIAATDTRDQAAAALPQREQSEFASMCSAGVVVTDIGRPTLDSMTKRAQVAAPSTTRATTIVQQLRQEIAGLGPQPAPISLPEGCPVARNADQAIVLARAHGSKPQHQGPSTIPPGTYVTTVTVKDFNDGGQYGPDWEKDITYTTILRADHTFLGTQKPDYPDQGPGWGTYTVKGDVVTFTFTGGQDLLPEVVKWSYFNGELTFTIVDVQDTNSRVIYTAHPWRRVR